MTEIRPFNDADAMREGAVETFKRLVRDSGIETDYDADIEFMGEALVAFRDEVLRDRDSASTCPVCTKRPDEEPGTVAEATPEQQAECAAFHNPDPSPERDEAVALLRLHRDWLRLSVVDRRKVEREQPGIFAPLSDYEVADAIDEVTRATDSDDQVTGRLRRLADEFDARSVAALNEYAGYPEAAADQQARVNTWERAADDLRTALGEADHG